ncbi:hypothetical protein [Nocardia asiatica]|uniref:hypothetical protein n=1 Tax=Nocardia asiatica TaxID=209252 RepID=UPI0012FADE1D|nr:hypothetical protein [Nocardia asiatica]
MTEISVRLVAGARDWILADEPRIVPASPLVLVVKGNQSSSVSLDGRLMRLSSGLLPVDLTRSTGYHRFEVDGRTFWFGTEDAKLRLAGIESMLNELNSLGVGWSGQMLFSDGRGMRDPHVVYGWLDAYAELALTAAAAVLAAPRMINTRSTALSRRGGANVLRAPTLKLLRSAPREYLAPDAEGILTMPDGRRYDPLRVVVKKRYSTLDTIANRRVVELLTWLIKLTKEVLASDPSTRAKTRCRLWANRASTLALKPVAQSLQHIRHGQPALRQPEELTDRRYRTTYTMATDIHRLFGWSASSAPLPRYSYIDRSDQIYQAYVASKLAKELGLHQTQPILGSSAIAFAGPQFDLYYDTVCPPAVLRSWRASSSRPDHSRPDILLHERETGRVAILDAKYRIAQDGKASEDSRKEVTSYLGLYGLESISIIYPGDGSPETISGHGRSIHEIPLRPSIGLEDSLPLIMGSLQLPPF